MRFLAVKKESFISGIGYKIIFLMFFSLAGSFMPEWSLTFFVLNILLILIGAVLSAYWYKQIPDPRTYDRLTSIIMFLLTGFFLITPILRLVSETAALWMFILSYVLFIMNFLTKIISISPELRGKSKFLPAIGLAFFIIGFLLRDNGEAIIGQAYSQHQAALVFGIILAIIGFIFTLGSSSFIKSTDHSR